MFSSPVVGYFKQLQDYYGAKAHHSGEPGPAFDTDPTLDTVALSPTVDPSGRRFSYLDTLTESNKAFRKGCNGLGH